MRVRSGLDVHGLGRRVRALARVGAGGRPSVRENVVSLVVLVVMLTTVTQRTGSYVAPSGGLLAATAVAWLVVATRTVRPVVSLVCAVAVDAVVVVLLAVPDSTALVTSGMGAYQPAPLATLVVASTVASRVPQRFGWTASAAAGAVLLASGALAHGRAFLLVDLVVFYLVLSGGGVGVLVTARRERTARAARDLEEHMRRAVLDERLRIARELHDVLAHNLTLVNAQAGVAEYLLRHRPEQAAAALDDITKHTARAIDELAATIGLLRSSEQDRDGDDDLLPVPDLDDVVDLVASFRDTGARVELVVHGRPRPLARTAGLAAYRVVQEALTNATKHAPGTATVVELAWSDDALVVSVTNDAPAQPLALTAPGTRHGLLGLHERAASAGGSLTAGPVPEGGFRVAAELPVGTADEPTTPRGDG